MLRIIILMAALSAVIGFTLGTVFTPHTSATHVGTVSLSWRPPAGATQATNQCGWHANCLNDFTGNGLDFTAGADYRVFLRAKGFVPNVFSSIPIATAQTAHVTYKSCSTLRAQIFGFPSGVLRMTNYYLHSTNLKFPQASLRGVDSGYYNNSHLGDMLTSADTCSWTAAHVHEESPDATVAWSNYPTGPAGKGCCLSATSSSNATRSKTWTE